MGRPRKYRTCGTSHVTAGRAQLAVDLGAAILDAAAVRPSSPHKSVGRAVLEQPPHVDLADDLLHRQDASPIVGILWRMFSISSRLTRSMRLPSR